MLIAIPDTVFAAAAHRAVHRAITGPPAMRPVQIASLLKTRTRHLDVDGLRDLIEARIESEQLQSRFAGWSHDRLFALQHALASTGSDTFADKWAEWRGEA